jgi:serine O-acetyltransferase
VLFTGRETLLRSHLMMHVQAQLAPLGLRMLEQHPGEARRADFRVVFEAPAELSELDDAVLLRRGASLPAMVGETVGAILRWLEHRVERRYPGAVVGANPWPAKMLQRFPWTGFFLQSRVACRIRSPVLMPHPHGIFIERGVEIGSRVTVMHQVTIGRKNPTPPAEQGGGVPVIEDNVFIGPGAKLLGPVRVGRGATVGANAVVTRDVPSHCTVVGANRILGVEAPAVAARRREEEDTVVNT